MNDSLIRKGGPHNVRQIGDKYYMDIAIPEGPDGLIGRECPNQLCSPGYFKVKKGTGITEGQTEAFCPYCRHSANPEDFMTREQKDYALEIAKGEILGGVEGALREALGLGSSGKKTIGGSFLKMEVSLKSSPPPPTPSLVEEELRRDVCCPNCHLEHAVFGLATWCPDCGSNIFLIHVEQELSAISNMLEVVETRRAELGARVAARDIENALEDVVSIFEAVMKVITIRLAEKAGKNSDEIDVLLKSIGNAYQNLSRTEEIFLKHFNINPFEGVEAKDLLTARVIFEKRHPITHNLGIVDKKYIQRARSGEVEGREVRITTAEVEKAIEFCRYVLCHLYQDMLGLSESVPAFPSAPQSVSTRIPGLNVSPTAQQICLLLCQKSEHGTTYDPHMDVETLAGNLNEVCVEVLEEALDELNEKGIIEYEAHDGYVSPRHALFWYTDAVVKGWYPKEDARTCAELLLQEGERNVPITYISEKTGWPPRRLNVAVSYLSERGLIYARTAMGTYPWGYYELEATVKTRRFLKDNR